MIDKERLAAKCAAEGLALTGEMLDKLDKYAQCLVDYNQKVNLTADSGKLSAADGIGDDLAK